MARKKPGRGRPEKRRRPKSAPQGPPSGFPDRRALEGQMSRHLQELTGAADTPLSRAQDVVYKAFEERDPARRLDLARQALAICPDCADAYLLQAEQARTRGEALALYEQAVAAGERGLGPEAFERDAGHFWGILETRPYMRARLELALALWIAVRREEAVGHLQDMLRLNPNDNQGVRYTLAGFLLFLERGDDLARLLQQFHEEESAMWLYNRTLHAFQQTGDTPESRQLLERAKKANPHIADFLLGKQFPPPERLGYYVRGDVSEAVSYLGNCLPAWKDTPGAAAWLRANDEQTRKRKAQTPSPKGPLGFIKKWLREKLPQEYDVWQADARMMEPVKIAGEKVRPWMVLVTSQSSGLVLAHNILDEEPAAAHLWDTLVQAMQNPIADEPHRPTEVQVRAGKGWESLMPHAEEIGVSLAVADELEHADDLFADMRAHLDDKPWPGLLDVPGMKPEQAASFYEAAARFFEQAPWKRLGFEAAIKVECAKYHSGPWYAVVMGGSGLTTGLVLYEDLDAIRKLREETDDKENARESVATSLIFGDDIDLALADVEAVKQYGWKVARPDAYPWVFHKERGLSHRPPLVWELELMESCLRALPDFVQRRKQDDPAREEFTVTVAAGEVRLALSWVQEPWEQSDRSSTGGQ